MTALELLAMVESGTHVLVRKDKYDKLLRDQVFLGYLQDAGIDNCAAYEHGCVAFHEAYPDTEDLDSLEG